jgi:hypothetical protein
VVAVAFFDTRPVKVLERSLPGAPGVSIVMRDGFEFVMDYSDYETLDEMTRLFEEARSKLGALLATHSSMEVKAIEVEVGDELLIGRDVRKLDNVVITNDGIYFRSAHDSFGPFHPQSMVEIIGQSPAIGMPNFSKAGA